MVLNAFMTWWFLNKKSGPARPLSIREREFAWRMFPSETSKPPWDKHVLSFEGGPGLLSYAGKDRRICDSQISKDLSVQSDLGLLEPLYQPVVRQAVHASSRADSGYPESPEIPLSSSPVGISVSHSSLDRFFGGPI